MKAIQRGLAQCAAAALCLSPLAQTARAQTDKQKREFEKALTESPCKPGSPDYPDYPFSVDRLARALKINGVWPQQVHVLVVDNGFIGYRQRVSQDEGPSFTESNNYPIRFFDVLREKELLPFLDFEDAGLSRQDEADPMKGHGTHVGGIVLGGMYQKGTPKAGGDNLLEPNVRRLLLDNPNVEKAQDAKPWLTLRFVPLGYGSGAAATDPVDKLKKALEKGESASATIVNMSLARTLTSFSTPYALPETLRKDVLVILAAGNATMQLERDINALPAKLEASEQLLIVGSHDADGKLSHFSNYGDPVAIAAPGCQIQSWPNGDGAPQALSGTSMSTAVVTFAAALVRSQWGAVRGAALRHRLLVSARYESQLAQCDRAKAQTNVDTDPKECVSGGAMLDIEAAVIVRKDLIEYEECPGDSGKNCTRLTAVGNLSTVPQSIAGCIYPRPYPSMGYAGLTYNGAVKRIAKGRYAIASEAGQEVGRVPLRWDPCPVPEANSSDLILFDVTGLQLGGNTVDVPQRREIKISQLHRIVTRVKP
ncbi:MAG: S8 family serine peptidase [Sphingomonas sp.]